jgi:NADPH:quinone reductase-like Zn-dependent oxidoreductase
VAQTGASSATAGYILALARHAGLRTLNVVRRASAVQSLLDAGADVVLVSGVADGTLVAPVDATYGLEDHRAALGHASQNGDDRNGKVLFSFERSTR